MRQLLALIAAERAFDPFFGRHLPSLVASVGLAEAGHEAVACHRQGHSPSAEVLARSLEQARSRTAVIAPSTTASSTPSWRRCEIPRSRSWTR